MKPLEKIKNALECCFQYQCCIGCPYYDPHNPSSVECVKQMGLDALLSIQQLEACARLQERLEDDLK